MKRRLSRKGLIVLAAAAVIALITLISVSVGGRGGVFTSAVNGVSMPLKRLSAAVASQIESIYGYMYKYDEVVKENEQLHMQLAALERERREYVEVSEENELKYRDFLSKLIIARQSLPLPSLSKAAS